MGTSTSLITLLVLAGAHAPPQVVPATAIVQAVQAGLMRLPGTDSHVEIRVDGRVADQLVPAGKARIALGNIAGTWPRAHVGVPVEVLVDERRVRSLTVWVEAKDERSVPTYAASYPAHLPADRTRFTSAVVDMSCCEGAVIDKSRIGSDARLKQAVREGQPVLAADFEVAPDIAAQQHVTIEVIHGSVHLSVPGIALRDARIGERVDVRPDQSEKAVSSRVVSRQKVIVE